jgi:hypothetical protein
MQEEPRVLGPTEVVDLSIECWKLVLQTGSVLRPFYDQGYRGPYE